MRGLVAYALCAVLGGVLGAFVAQPLLASGDEPARSARMPATTPSAPTAADSRHARQMDELLRRIEALERAASVAGGSSKGDGNGNADGDAEGNAEGDAEGQGEATLDRRVAEFLAPYLEGPVGPTETGAIFEYLARNKEQIGEAISLLRAAVREDPENPDRRLALASALVAKLQNDTAPGPQQGLVWQEAVKEYDKVIELDPPNWTARYSKAFGTTFIPAQFGSRPLAIKQFGKLLEIQEQRAPEPHYVNTYYQLGRLYGEAGNPEKAAEIWQRGLRLFPDDPTLQEALEVSRKR